MTSQRSRISQRLPNRTPSVPPSASTSFADLIPTQDICAGILDDIIDKILDDQFEKYHEEEVISWTVEYFEELLKEALDFAFVDCDEGSDLVIDCFFPEDALEDPQNRVDDDGAAGEDAEVLSELMEHRFVDVSWLEDSDHVIFVPPLDNWATGGVPVTKIVEIDCEDEAEGEEVAEGKEEITVEEGKRDLGTKKKKTRRKKQPEAGEETPKESAVAAAAVAGEDSVAKDANEIPSYIPRPLQRHPYPWVGLSRTKKKVPQRRPPPPPHPVRGGRGLGEGRRLGRQAACTCQLICPPVIYEQIPHTTQSGLRAHYLLPQDAAKNADDAAPQCEACFGAPVIEAEKIEVGAGAVYLENRKMTPENWAPRFVDCGVRIPPRRRKEDADAGKDGEKPGARKKAVSTMPARRKGGDNKPKKPPARFSFDGAAVDDPKDPLHGSRVIPNIHLSCGVSVKAGNDQLMGPPFPKLDAHVKPENAEFFANFSIEERWCMERVASKPDIGAPRVKWQLPKLTPDVKL